MKKTAILLFLFFQLFIFGQEKEILETTESNDEVVKITETIPGFQGCDETDNKNALICFKQKIAEHIKNNMKYPEKALRKKIQGRIMVSFIINKEGNIENIVTKAPENCENCEILEKEAIRIISLLPKFKPGMQKGKPVKVRYSQPITFKLR